MLNGRYFTSKWERISRKQLPVNIRVTKKRTVGPRRNNRLIYLNQAAPAFKKIKIKIKQNAINKLGPIYDRVQRQQQSAFDRLGPVYDRVQGGRGLASNLAKAGFELGSKAISSEFGKKLINKKVRNAMNSERADMLVQEAQNRAKNKYDSLFG